MTTSLRLAATMLLGTALLSSPALGEDIHSDEAGKMLYLHYCSSCHGEKGAGDGALAPILDVEPTDLTQLKKQAGGEFSFLSLLRSIDGTRNVRGHGKPDMPVWGELFRSDEKAPMGEQLRGAGKLLLITYHVESLQED